MVHLECGGNDTGQLGYGEEASTNPNTPVKIELGPQLKIKLLQNMTPLHIHKLYLPQKVNCTPGEIMKTADLVLAILIVLKLFSNRVVMKMTSGPIFGIVVVIFMLLKTINFMVLEKTVRSSWTRPRTR